MPFSIAARKAQESSPLMEPGSIITGRWDSSPKSSPGTILKKLSGRNAIGHVRYSTAGSSELKNAQPFLVDYAQGGISIAHNGNLTNAFLIRSELESNGSIFQSNMDTEVIVHLIAHSKEKTFVERTIQALKQVEGSYSLLFLTEHEMVVARDPYGFRPLVLGQTQGFSGHRLRDLCLRSHQCRICQGD